MFKIAIQFVLSGTIVVLASYLSPRVGQKWAGLLVAAPLLTLLTFIFLSLEPTSGDLRDYLMAALLYMIPAALFILCLLLFSQRLNFVVNILISLVFFSFAALIVHRFVRSI